MTSRMVSACVAILALMVSAAVAEPVVVNVFYESLCPDSIRFVTKQVAPAFEALGEERMIVDFIPYGKAVTTVLRSGGYSFRCQHGPSECQGNKLQACGLSRLQGAFKKQVQFVNCVMSAENPARPGAKCATDVGLDADELSLCATTNEGDVLLASMGDRTPLPLKFVPTVGFQGVVSAAEQENALYRLLKTVCEKLAVAQKSSACQREQSWFFMW